MALTEYHRVDPADMHPALALARYGKRRTADLFVGFWLALIVEAQQMRPNVRGAARHAEKFLGDRSLRAAVDEAGQGAVDAELADAARVYYASGLEDSSYTSGLMRMKRLTGQQVREKAAGDVAKTSALILEAGLDERLIELLVHGYLEALAPHGARELRDAAQRHPHVQARLESALGN